MRTIWHLAVAVCLCADVWGATGFQWRTGRIGEIVYPSRSPAVMDTWQRRGQDYSYPPYAQFFHPFNLQGNPPPRHGGGHSSDQATFNSATVYAGDGFAASVDGGGW